MTETKETGPVQSSIWDTRTEANCDWCTYCSKWICKDWPITWVPRNKRLEYHQVHYCKKSPVYQGEHA